jgi:hypothetical protein
MAPPVRVKTGGLRGQAAAERGPLYLTVNGLIVEVQPPDSPASRKLLVAKRSPGWITSDAISSAVGTKSPELQNRCAFRFLPSPARELRSENLRTICQYLFLGHRYPSVYNLIDIDSPQSIPYVGGYFSRLDGRCTSLRIATASRRAQLSLPVGGT